jgi:hypothetical protein
MAGKGDARRPTTVTRKELEDNWRRTFPAKPKGPEK